MAATHAVVCTDWKITSYQIQIRGVGRENISVPEGRHDGKITTGLRKEFCDKEKRSKWPEYSNQSKTALSVLP